MSHIHTDPADTEFNKQALIVDYTRKDIRTLKVNLQQLETKLKQATEQLQSICEHNFVRECINDGCYREYATVCRICQKFK